MIPKKMLALGTAAVAGLATAVVGIAAATTASAAGGTPLPPHVFAPYFEAYSSDNAATVSSQSGAQYLTLAFLQTKSKGDCGLYWDGDSSRPVSQNEYGSQIAQIRAAGGNVVPSLGGYGADDTGTELSDSCTDVGQIATALENVVTTYDATRIDLDIEDKSLNNAAAIDRRNQAIKRVEDWAASNGRTVQFQYTLPTTTSGLAGSGLKVLKSAVANDARIDIVNIMTFDYYDGANHEMANDTKTAAAGLVKQLGTLYPTKSTADLWGMVGITEMPGIDDYGAAETFTTADATAVEQWATQQGIASLSFWAIQRDTGGCPGTAGSDTCSGVTQSTWQFTKAMIPFTSGTGTVTPPPVTTPPVTAPPTTPPVTTPPTTPPVTTPPTSPSTCSAAAWKTGTVYTGGQQASSGGDLWTAQWWTTGEKPGTSAVWVDQGACGGSSASTTPPAAGTCTVAAWSSSQVYSGGKTSSYSGHVWKAQWWTQGETPGAALVWADQGSC